jgi:SAM-dependent methyltransferase
MTQAEPGRATASVAAYYDQNTPRFLRLGGSGEAAAIHRAIWADGVQNPAQAFEYLNQFVAGAVQPVLEINSPARLLDLGCGVGGTATWLARRLSAQVIGVTNSAMQRQTAVERAERLGLSERCTFLLADFMELPPLPAVNAAWAIESLVHAPDAGRFFAQAARQVVSGGRLVVCDDFLSQAGAASPPGSPPARWLERFRRGWHVHNLLTVEQADQLAWQAGFNLLGSVDLTPFIRSSHPWLLAMLATITRLPLRWAYWQNLSGGSALQVCIRQGWTCYRALIWEKEESCTQWLSNETLLPGTS